MRIRRKDSKSSFNWWPRRTRYSQGLGYSGTWLWLWWIFKPDPEPILTRLQNSRWRPIVLVPYKAWMLARRQTTCRLGWHLWCFGYSTRAGAYRYCEACDTDEDIPLRS